MDSASGFWRNRQTKSFFQIYFDRTFANRIALGHRRMLNKNNEETDDE